MIINDDPLDANNMPRNIKMNDDAGTIEVKVCYQGMCSTLWINLSEYENAQYYLEVIKDHVDIAKKIIDNQNSTV
jgi:nitrogen regulatory protein PII-like uncharacterized protein